MQTSLPEVFTVNSAHIANGTLNVNETVKLAEDTVNGLLLEHHERSSVGQAVPDEVCQR
jgi:hypothetical protein